MCLMLYLGSHRELPLQKNSHICVELNDDAAQVRDLIGTPYCYFIGSHAGCSCGFPSVLADEPIDYYEGMFASNDDRALDLESTRELFDLLANATQDGVNSVLFPTWNDGESEIAASKGTVVLHLSEMKPETFVLTEGFQYIIHRA